MARPVSLLTSLLLVVAVILVVIFIVAPELGKTFVSLGKTISDFIPEMQDWVEELFNGNPAVVSWVQELEFDWNKNHLHGC